MNEWLRTFSQKFNDILTSGYDSNNNPGTMMFTSDKTTDNEQYKFPSSSRYDLIGNPGDTITIKTGDDSYYRMTAKNFAILSAMELDPDLVANKFKQGDGVEQDDLLQALKVMVNDKDKMSFRGASASEFLQCILSDVALNTSRANTFQKSFSDISDSIDKQRLAISGVDEEEEAISLVKYQHGYNLASQMIQTLTEVYDRLILETGV